MVYDSIIILLNPLSKTKVMIELSVDYKTKYDVSRAEDLKGRRVHYSEMSLERETSFMKDMPFENQHGWVGPRIATLESSRQIVNEVFDPDGKVIVEFGCGAYGWLYNQLVQGNGNWTQFDINQNVVEHNKEYAELLKRDSSKISVGSMYDMPLASRSVDAITGLSSWDSILFHEKNIKEMRRCLKPNGFFIHFQDIQPADKILLFIESQKRNKRGLDPKVPCGMGFGKPIPIYIPNTKIKIGESRIDEFLTIDSQDYGEVRLAEYLHKHLADLLKEEGFDILLCEEKQKEVLVKKREFFKRLRRFNTKFKGPENCFGDGYGYFNYKIDSSVPKGHIKEWKSMDVLIAQKID